MNSMELSMLLYDKGETNDEVKCAKFDGNDMHTTQHNTVDMRNDDSSDSSCEAHDENLRNSASSIDTVVMLGESMGARAASSLCSKTDTGHHTSFMQTVCAPSGSALLNGMDGGVVHYANAFTNGAIMNPGPPQAPVLNIRFPSGLHKMKREWRAVGWFTSDAAMNEVRKREKVSKRKSVAQINGTKVFYRCNNWRRTNCNFRMYALYHAPDQITLYASGEHDHTTKNPHYVPRNYTGSMIYNLTPTSSQQQALDQFVMHATANSSSLPAASRNRENVFEMSSVKNDSAQPSDVPPYLDNLIKTEVERSTTRDKDDDSDEFSFQLGDGQSIAQLLQLATQIDHTFTFNSRRNSEYCFESNIVPGKVIAFTDLGDVVSVIERCNGIEKSCEQWRKADWNQFLWAVRGRCSNAMKHL